MRPKTPIRAASRALRSRPGVVLALAGVTVVVLAGVLAPWLAPHDPNALDPSASLRPPAWLEGGSSHHPLGTDQLGRDVLSRLMYGARSSLTIATGAVLIAVLVGTAVGITAGYFGGLADVVLMRVADVQIAFPFILLALSLLSVTETRTLWTVMVVLAIADWVIHARVVRGRVLAERDLDYVQAARALGAGHLRTILVYVLPSVLPTILTIAMLQLGVLMVVESVLAFVGLGIESPAVSWGTILADGRRSIATAWWLLLFPGLAIFVAVLAINLVADGLPDLLDPRLTRTKAPAKSDADKTAEDLSVRAGMPGNAGVAEAADSARAPTAANDPVLIVSRLRVQFAGQTVVRDLSLAVGKGERVGIVGESGSGKSVTFLALLGLAPRVARVSATEVTIGGRRLGSLTERELRRHRGNEVSMIFQDPGAALNPTMRIAAQVREVLARNGVPRADRAAAVLDALRVVQLADPERIAGSYPFQLSGGQQQRVMMAMAMAARPLLLVADEPTTALDVTTQNQILSELDTLTNDSGTAVVFISHDLGVVAEFTDRIVVLYNGMLCEVGPTEELMTRPKHPYTQSLVSSVQELSVVGDDREHIELVAPDRGVPDRGTSPASGCSFAPRCHLAAPVCWDVPPALSASADHAAVDVACHALPKRTEVPAR